MCGKAFHFGRLFCRNGDSGYASFVVIFRNDTAIVIVSSLGTAVIYEHPVDVLFVFSLKKKYQKEPSNSELIDTYLNEQQSIKLAAAAKCFQVSAIAAPVLTAFFEGRICSVALGSAFCFLTCKQRVGEKPESKNEVVI